MSKKLDELVTHNCILVGKLQTTNINEAARRSLQNQLDRVKAKISKWLGDEPQDCRQELRTAIAERKDLRRRAKQCKQEDEEIPEWLICKLDERDDYVDALKEEVRQQINRVCGLPVDEGGTS